MDQVNLVDAAGGAKLPAAAAGIGNLGILLISDQVTGICAEIRQSIGNGQLRFRQVHDGQGGGLAPALLGTGIYEIVDDIPADFRGGTGGVVAYVAEPVGIVPADARLGFLAGNQVIGMLCKHQGCFRGGHQAGIEANKVKLHTALGQGLVNFRQIHGAGGREFFVITEAADGAAAVIPENQGHPVSGMVLCAPADEGSQGLRVGHGFVARILLQADQIVIGDLPNLVGTAA